MQLGIVITDKNELVQQEQFKIMVVGYTETCIHNKDFTGSKTLTKYIYQREQSKREVLECKTQSEDERNWKVTKEKKEIFTNRKDK